MRRAIATFLLVPLGMINVFSLVSLVAILLLFRHWNPLDCPACHYPEFLLDKRNLFNRVFVKFGLLWTFIPTAIYALLVIGTELGIWLFFLSFLKASNATSNSPTTSNNRNAASSHQESKRWRLWLITILLPWIYFHLIHDLVVFPVIEQTFQLDVSGHVFILTHTTLFLILCALPIYKSHQQRYGMNGIKVWFVQGLIIYTYVLVAIWIFMLISTCLLFHLEFPVEKWLALLPSSIYWLFMHRRHGVTALPQ